MEQRRDISGLFQGGICKGCMYWNWKKKMDCGCIAGIESAGLGDRFDMCDKDDF